MSVRLALTLCAGACLALTPATFAQSKPLTKSTEKAGEKTRVGRIDLEGKLLEQLPEMSFLLGGTKEHTLRSVVTAIKDAANDGDIDALMIRFKDAEITSTQVQEIAEAIKVFKESGKKVHVFSDAYGPTELMLGAYADEVIAQAGSGVSMPGMYMEEMFLADTLAWAGVKADFVQVGDYKGASEALARNAPSPQWDQNINQLLDSLYANMRAPILQGRKMSDSQLDSAMGDLWMSDADQAKKLGVLDTVIDLPTIPQHLREQYDHPIAWDTNVLPEHESTLDLSNPFALLGMLGQKPDYSTSGPTIAVIHINGPIIDGESKSGGGIMGGGPSVGSRTIRNAIEDLIKNDDIKGVVIRINSPGGSAIASEVIWQGFKRLAEKKPVWTSVGNMAASGGYYIAVSGEKIYANPSSIVGSIGVVGGKMTLKDLYGKFKVNVVGRGRGPKASMFASDVPWSEQDISDVRKKMTDTYELFTKRVSEGRKGIDLSKTAEGRLFTGDKAVNMKMVDKVGGLDVAVKDLADSLKLADFDVKDYPAPRSFQEVIQESLGGMVSAPNIAGHSPLSRGQMFSVIREIIGDKAYAQIEPQLQGMMQMREGKVLLMSPSALVFK
ncbi:MAG: S49 family peptidase [Phycisphaerales bacterium]